MTPWAIGSPSITSTTSFVAGSMMWTLSPAAFVWMMRTLPDWALIGPARTTLPNAKERTLERRGVIIVNLLAEAVEVPNLEPEPHGGQSEGGITNSRLRRPSVARARPRRGADPHALTPQRRRAQSRRDTLYINEARPVRGTADIPSILHMILIRGEPVTATWCNYHTATRVESFGRLAIEVPSSRTQVFVPRRSRTP